MFKPITRKYFDFYGNFSDVEYYEHKFGTIPHCYNSGDISRDCDAEIHKKHKLKPIGSFSSSCKTGVIISSFTWEIPNRKVILTVSEDGSNFRFKILHPNTDFSQSIIKYVDGFYTKRNQTENKISIIIQSASGELQTREFAVKIGEIDVELNYGKEFVPVYEKVVSRLNKENDKGLILFHGLPGTGKTSLIKYITKHLKKEVMFIPSNLGESLCSPSFIPFLLNHSNSVIIIEDAEKIIADRSSKESSFGVSNILNISDGILGDCLNIQIVATFNTKRDKIDPALLRKGRLIAEHEFGKLTVEQSNKVIKSIGIKTEATEPMTIGEIYNAMEEDMSIKKTNGIGFAISPLNSPPVELPQLAKT